MKTRGPLSESYEEFHKSDSNVSDQGWNLSEHKVLLQPWLQLKMESGETRVLSQGEERKCAVLAWDPQSGCEDLGSCLEGS
jgi:hypothetical protein